MQLKCQNSGNVNENINFEYGEDTIAHYGCGATLFGQFWYFGGNKEYKRQVYVMCLSIMNQISIKASKIEVCKLVRQHDLPFDYFFGSCNTFLQPTEKVLLCFDYDQPQTCHT